MVELSVYFTFAVTCFIEIFVKNKKNVFLSRASRHTICLNTVKQSGHEVGVIVIYE